MQRVCSKDTATGKKTSDWNQTRLPFDKTEALRIAEEKHQTSLRKNEQKSLDDIKRRTLEDEARAARYVLRDSVALPELHEMETFLKERNYRNVKLTVGGAPPAAWPSCSLTWRSITDHSPELSVKFDIVSTGIKIGGQAVPSDILPEHICQKLWEDFNANLGL